MPALLLSEEQQAAVRALVAAEPSSDVDPPGEELLQVLARLIDCDAIGTDLLAGAGSLGIHLRHGPVPGDSAGQPGAAVLSLGVRSSAQRVVTLWMVRRTSDFSARDRAMLRLVAPALERVLREPPAALTPLLTEQERRVLRHVAVGLSNVEIAERLVVAPCTVSKHLENAYRKLGVSNRLAAVHAVSAGEAGRVPAQRESARADTQSGESGGAGAQLPRLSPACGSRR